MKRKCARMHPKQSSRYRKRKSGTSEDQKQLPPLSSRLLDIAAVNFYDEQSNADQNIEDICRCEFFQSLTKAIMPHHTDAIDDFPSANHIESTFIGMNEGRTLSEERKARPIHQKQPRSSETPGTTPITDLPCRKCSDEDNNVADDEATEATAATEDCSFAAWDIDLPHSPRPTGSRILSTTISTSPLQPSTKLFQRYSNSSSGSLSSGNSNKPIRSSSGSSSNSRSPGCERKKVSFLAGYISEVHVQPRVSAEDWSNVFYSPREIQLMWDDFLREGFGRVDILISEDDGVSSGSPGAQIIMGEVLEDEADCGLYYSKSESDDDCDACDNANGSAYQSQSGRRRPRADASADTLLVGERRS